MDGNTFRDSHGVDKKPFVADVQVGFAFHYCSMRIAISNVWRSREFEDQSGHVQYCAINVSFFLPD